MVGLKKFCCTEAERAQQLRIDELVDKKSQSTRNQLTVQIQELQDKVNSLNESSEFYDLETASSFRLSHVPSHSNSIQSPHGMLSRDSGLQPDTRNSSGTSGNVFEDPRAPNEPTAACFANARSLTDTHYELVSLNTGRHAAKAEELETKNQRFVKKFSPCNPPSHAEGAYPQNCMVEQPRNQVSEMHFDKSPNALTCQRWKKSFKTEVCGCSNFPTEAILWIKEVEMVELVDDLKTSRSIGGHRFPNLEILDAKIASALDKIIMNSYFKKNVSLEEQKAPMEDRCLRGRQIAFMIYEYFRVTGAHEAVLDLTDLFFIAWHDDDLQFTQDWMKFFLSISEVPNDIKQYWQCTNRASIRIYQSRVIRSWRPW